MLMPLMKQILDALDNLQTLSDQYHFVSTKSNSLHTACQHLLEEQTQLATLSQEIEKKLKFFTEADRINQKLTSTAVSVTSDLFIELLDKIDECMLYILDHVSC